MAVETQDQAVQNQVANQAAIAPAPVAPPAANTQAFNRALGGAPVAGSPAPAAAARVEAAAMQTTGEFVANPATSTRHDYFEAGQAKTKFDLTALTASLAARDGVGTRNEQLLQATVANIAGSNLSQHEAQAIGRAVADAYNNGVVDDIDLDQINALVAAANQDAPAVAAPPVFTPPPASGVAPVSAAPAVSSTPWTFTNNGNGTGHIDFGNYSLDLVESSMQWTLTNKQTGAQTRVWGDPHVDYHNDGSTDLDFKSNLTLMLDDHTKITCETVPYGNGATVSSRLVITDGNQAIEVTGLAGSADAPMNISKIDDAARAWDESWGKSIVYQGGDGAWYVASGLLQNGGLREDGSIDFAHVDKSHKLKGLSDIDGFHFWPDFDKDKDREKDNEVGSTETQSENYMIRNWDRLYGKMAMYAEDPARTRAMHDQMKDL